MGDSPTLTFLDMGIGVIVHGFIRTPGWGTQDPSERCYAHNQRVIESLPASDPEWPFFTRSMFTIPPLRRSFAVQIPQYETAGIHFLGEYKNMYVLEAAWIRKFEGLLTRLCWIGAKVYVDFGGLLYEWEPSSPYDGCMSNPPIPPKLWKLTCSQLKLEPIPVESAIDGKYLPPT